MLRHGGGVGHGSSVILAVTANLSATVLCEIVQR